jgi:acetyl-CoA decarbonylase/synthase complex subunit gamma
LVDDDLSAEDQRAKIEKIKALDFFRMGEQLRVDMVAVRSRTGSAVLLAEAARRVRDACDLPVALVTSDAAIARDGLTALGGGPVLLCFATKDNLEEMAAVARDFAVPLAVEGSVAELERLVERVEQLGVPNLLLAPVSYAGTSFSAGPDELTVLRRMAINEGRLGYPTLVYPVGPLSEAQEITWAAALVTKYAGVVFLESAEPHAVYPLLVLRQSVYADPTVPATVDPGLYTEGSPDRNSPILLTGNFAMTYSMVSSDVRSAGVNAYVVVADGQGYSVGVACLLGSIAPEQVARLLDETGVRDKVDHHCLIIPGLMEPLKDKLQAATGMEILVGPIDSRHIARYLEDNWHPANQAPQ